MSVLFRTKPDPAGCRRRLMIGAWPPSDAKMELLPVHFVAAWQHIELEFAPRRVIGRTTAQMDAVMISKCIALLFAAVALAGCCVSGTGCYAPVPGAPIAWDGLGPTPTENVDESKPKRNSRRNQEIIVGPLNDATAKSDPRSQPTDRWSEEQAADRDAEAKLNKKLRICANC
jgi:hypothetical protein